MGRGVCCVKGKIKTKYLFIIQEDYMQNKKIIFAVLLVLLPILACQSILVPGKDSPPPEEVYLGLRNIWFTTKPEDLDITFEPESKVPYAIVMDMGMDGNTVTIVSSIIGDGSMYTSTGGGVIGGIEHENVRKASIDFVKVSGRFIDKMELTTEFPLPSGNNIKFYLITPGGVYTTEEVDADMLASGNHELSPLFLAGNDVITELRITTGQ
jgi:hypothetical protein